MLVCFDHSIWIVAINSQGVKYHDELLILLTPEYEKPAVECVLTRLVYNYDHLNAQTSGFLFITLNLKRFFNSCHHVQKCFFSKQTGEIKDPKMNMKVKKGGFNLCTHNCFSIETCCHFIVSHIRKCRQRNKSLNCWLDMWISLKSMKHPENTHDIKSQGVRFILTLILFLLCYVAVMYCGLLLLVNRHGWLHFLLHGIYYC